MRRPVIYLRRSLIKNADNDLAAHRSRCEKVIQERGEPEPVVIQEEEGHRSAHSRTGRIGWQQVESLIDSNQVSTLYVNDRARVWRNDIEYMLFLMRAKQHDTEVVPVAESAIGDINDPAQRLIEYIKGWQNQAYRDDISKRLRATKNDYRIRGIFTGNTPGIGLVLVGSRFERHLEPNADFPIVLEFLERYTRTWNAIEAWRQMRGRTWTNGKPIELGVCQKIISRVERYAPHVPETLFNQVVSIRSQKANHKMNGAIQRRPFMLLRGLAFCELCGERLVTDTRVQQNRPVHRYYRHAELGCVQRSYNTEAIETNFWIEFDSLYRLPETQQNELRAHLMHPPQPSFYQDNTVRVEQIEKELRGYAKMRAMDEISTKQFLDFKAPLEQELESLQSAKPPAPAFAFSAADVDLLFDFGVIALQELAAVEPEKMNHLLRGMVRQVRISPPDCVKVEWIPPFDVIENNA